IVPAMVPVSSITWEGNTAVVLLAAIVKVTDRPPVENCTIGSSAGIAAADANAMFRVPETAKGYPPESDNASGNCCAGSAVSRAPLNDNGPMGGPTDIVKSCVSLAPLESMTRNLKLADAVAEGVPCSTPAEVKTKPGGKLPFTTDQEYGGGPPTASTCWEY